MVVEFQAMALGLGWAWYRYLDRHDVVNIVDSTTIQICFAIARAPNDAASTRISSTHSR